MTADGFIFGILIMMIDLVLIYSAFFLLFRASQNAQENKANQASKMRRKSKAAILLLVAAKSIFIYVGIVVGAVVFNFDILSMVGGIATAVGLGILLLVWKRRSISLSI